MAAIFKKSIQLDDFLAPCHPSLILCRHSTLTTITSAFETEV
nr:MAG TPA: hypothetical protein [Caudoviricetes sp.]